MQQRKIEKHFRIHPHYLNRMKRLLLPHQTETDFVEGALLNEILRQEAEVKFQTIGAGQ